MITGLRQAGVEVIECHADLWIDIEDRVNLTSGGWISPGFWLRVVRACGALISRFFRIPEYDVLLVGYPGQFDVYLARLLNLFRRKKICWDVLMSIYLVACERKLDQKSGFTVNLLKWVEKYACRAADLLILESQEYVDWFVHTHQVDPQKFRLVPLGALEPEFTLEAQTPPQKPADMIHVLYWGGFLRSHGVDCMIEAARLVQNRVDIRFDFIGSGPEREKMMALADRLNLYNVNFPGFLSYTELAQKIGEADICLGIFGDTAQSFLTIQNKIYECLSMGKPLISGISPLVARTFQHEKELYLCERNPESLAQAIQYLSSSSALRDAIGMGGRTAYLRSFSPMGIGTILKKQLENIICHEI
jgi:glycosyltransferase involved in cell wall biosynthesis